MNTIFFGFLLTLSAHAMDPHFEAQLKAIDPDQHFETVKKYLGPNAWDKFYVVGDEAVYDHSECDAKGQNCRLVAQYTTCVTSCDQDQCDISELVFAPRVLPLFTSSPMTRDHFDMTDGQFYTLGYLFYVASTVRSKDFLMRGTQTGTHIISAPNGGGDIETLEMLVGTDTKKMKDLLTVAVSNHPALPRMAQQVRTYMRPYTANGNVVKTELVYAARGSNGNKCRALK